MVKGGAKGNCQRFFNLRLLATAFQKSYSPSRYPISSIFISNFNNFQLIIQIYLVPLFFFLSFRRKPKTEMCWDCEWNLHRSIWATLYGRFTLISLITRTKLRLHTCYCYQCQSIITKHSINLHTSTKNLKRIRNWVRI